MRISFYFPNYLSIDHFPTILETVNTMPCIRWITEKADWGKLIEICNYTRVGLLSLVVYDATEAISAFHLDAANSCVPKTSSSFRTMVE